MFTVALFTIAKICGRNPECPSVDEQIKKMWCGDFPGGAVAEIHLPVQGPWIEPWSRELRSHMPQGLSPCDTTTS